MTPRWFILEAIFWKLCPCLFFLTAHNFANGPHFVALTQLRLTKTGSNICFTHLSYTFSESWVRKDSVGTCPKKFSHWKFSGTEQFTKKFHIWLISVSSNKKKVTDIIHCWNSGNFFTNKPPCQIVRLQNAYHYLHHVIVRLQNSVGKSHKTTLFTLIVIETCVKNCGKPFHLLVNQASW